MPIKKSGLRSPLEQKHTLLWGSIAQKTLKCKGFFNKKAGETDIFAEKTPQFALWGKFHPFFLRSMVRTRQAIRKAARSTSTTVAPTGVLTR